MARERSLAAHTSSNQLAEQCSTFCFLLSAMDSYGDFDSYVITTMCHQLVWNSSADKDTKARACAEMLAHLADMACSLGANDAMDDPSPDKADMLWLWRYLRNAQFALQLTNFPGVYLEASLPASLPQDAPMTSVGSCILTPGIPKQLDLNDNRDIYLEYPTLANMAYMMCERWQPPEHFAAFAHMALHSLSFTIGFGKLVHNSSKAESSISASYRRSSQLKLFHSVLRKSKWQHVKPGAFSQRTLITVAAWCKKDWAKMPFGTIRVQQILQSHESWCSALASLFRRYSRLYHSDALLHCSP